MESDVEAALELLLEAKTPISAEGVKAMATDGDKLASMIMDAPVVDLLIYDDLLHRQEDCV